MVLLAVALAAPAVGAAGKYPLFAARDSDRQFWRCRSCSRFMPTGAGAKSANSKALLRGLQEHVGAAPSEEQLDQLSQVIMRSQRNFKELIDSFDDPACAVSLDGTLRTVNKRVTELTGLTYSELVGQKIYDLVEEPTREEVERRSGTFSGEEALGRNGAAAAEEQLAAALLRLRAERNRQGRRSRGREHAGPRRDRAAREGTALHGTVRDLAGRRLLQHARGTVARCQSSAGQHAGVRGKERLAVGRAVRP